jgi:hypothetical protein
MSVLMVKKEYPVGGNSRALPDMWQLDVPYRIKFRFCSVTGAYHISSSNLRGFFFEVNVVANAEY